MQSPCHSKPEQSPTNRLWWIGGYSCIIHKCCLRCARDTSECSLSQRRVLWSLDVSSNPAHAHLSVCCLVGSKCEMIRWALVEWTRLFSRPVVHSLNLQYCARLNTSNPTALFLFNLTRCWHDPRFPSKINWEIWYMLGGGSGGCAPYDYLTNHRMIVSGMANWFCRSRFSWQKSANFILLRHTSFLLWVERMAFRDTTASYVCVCFLYTEFSIKV